MGYTNSPMVAYIKLSPNNSGERTHAIDRITPHCIVGAPTAEGLGDWFAKKSTKASSNYGIDRDGRIGMYVEEKKRSWCSSNNANDQRAVTIECASETKEPYAFTDTVYQKLIELCVDICKRNVKRKLLWLGDKDKTLKYQPEPDEMVLTVHRWFANKSCPGTWMMERMGDLAEKVTAKLGGAASADPEKVIWDFLLARIGCAYGVAGLMGNLYAESTMKSAILQKSYEKKLNITSEEYTRLVDDGAYPDFAKDKAGYGLCQWTFWSRKQALLDFAKSTGKSIGDLSMQLDFLWKELKDSYPAVLTVLQGADSVRQASDAVLLWYERPADQSEAVQVKRAGYGQGYYEKYAAGGGTGSSEGVNDPACPFRVRVTVKDLRIRAGAGTDTAWTGKYVPPGVYTIVEAKDGKGSEAGWGRLKSGAGWIALSFAKRV
ncbi:MAG: N-acetylmuramoyl-L-alanine amidase [Oribacterium sp.]|nr:N-acetylmuramoyl-L-alanine amidase [Oribacterium sp.]